MPRQRGTPQMRKTARGLAVTKFNGRSIHLGKWGDPAAQRKFDALLKAWIENGRKLPDTRARGASTVREVVNNLDPALRAALLDGTKLKPNLAVAVDGAVAPMGLLERVEPGSEIHFVAAISGGSANQ